MFNEQQHFKGNLSVVLNKDTDKEQVYEFKNLVVTVGKTFIFSRMASAADAVMSHMAVGSGTNAAAVGDTTLQTEVDRNALTSITPAAGQITYVGFWAAGDATASLNEAGIFNDGTTGTMLARSVFPLTISKGVADTLTITWVISA
jgi:hypothetical protein